MVRRQALASARRSRTGRLHQATFRRPRRHLVGLRQCVRPGAPRRHALACRGCGRRPDQPQRAPAGRDAITHGGNRLWAVTPDTGLFYRENGRWHADPGNAQLPPTPTFFRSHKPDRCPAASALWAGSVNDGLWYREKAIAPGPASAHRVSTPATAWPICWPPTTTAMTRCGSPSSIPGSGGSTNTACATGAWLRETCRPTCSTTWSRHRPLRATTPYGLHPATA